MMPTMLIGKSNSTFGKIVSMSSMYTIEPDDIGWSVLFNGYPLYRGLSLDGAVIILERYMDRVEPITWGTKEIENECYATV